MKKSKLKQLIREIIKENVNSLYVQSVVNFIDYPWQEDTEIEFVSLIDQYRDKILKSDNTTIKNYLNQMKEQLTGSALQFVSDKFIEDLDSLTN